MGMRRRQSRKAERVISAEGIKMHKMLQHTITRPRGPQQMAGIPEPLSDYGLYDDPAMQRSNSCISCVSGTFRTGEHQAVSQMFKQLEATCTRYYTT